MAVLEAVPSVQPRPAWWAHPRFQTGILIAAVIAAVYFLIYRDVLSRARESYEKAERYMDWYRHPELKRQYFSSEFEHAKAGLDKDLKAKRISEDDYRQKLDMLQFNRDFSIQESSVKYAYQWYKDTFELFSPPDSKWVRLAREKAPQALSLWKQELSEKKVPFDDKMFE
jgi:hypothetical protein